MRTKTNYRLKIKLAICVLVTLAPLCSQAAIVTERYKNSTAITDLFLWSDDPTVMTFAGVDLSDKKLAGWSGLNFGDRMVIEGPEIKKNKGKFDIDFDYTVAPFTLQYAEVMYDAVTSIWTVEATGQLEYNGKKLKKPTANPLSALQSSQIKAHFAPAAAVVPIPSSVVLMLSAIAFMGIAGRKHGAAIEMPIRV